MPDDLLVTVKKALTGDKWGADLPDRNTTIVWLRLLLDRCTKAEAAHEYAHANWMTAERLAAEAVPPPSAVAAMSGVARGYDDRCTTAEAEAARLKAENEKYSAGMQENCALRAENEQQHAELVGLREQVSRGQDAVNTLNNRLAALRERHAAAEAERNAARAEAARLRLAVRAYLDEDNPDEYPWMRRALLDALEEKP